MAIIEILNKNQNRYHFCIDLLTSAQCISKLIEMLLVLQIKQILEHEQRTLANNCSVFPKNAQFLYCAVCTVGCKKVITLKHGFESERFVSSGLVSLKNLSPQQPGWSPIWNISVHSALSTVETKKHRAVYVWKQIVEVARDSVDGRQPPRRPLPRLKKVGFTFFNKALCIDSTY